MLRIDPQADAVNVDGSAVWTAMIFSFPFPLVIFIGIGGGKHYARATVSYGRPSPCHLISLGRGDCCLWKSRLVAFTSCDLRLKFDSLHVAFQPYGVSRDTRWICLIVVFPYHPPCRVIL